MKNNILSKFRLIITGVFFALLSGCATTQGLDERDPWEGFNRGVYAFNEAADNLIFNPLTSVYEAITPEFLDNGISNMFSNIRQIPAIINDLLQFKFGKAVNDLVRFFINSTWGMLGFHDIVGTAVPKGGEDFGQTLAHWGVGSGPYLVLPFFGPSSIRDAAGFGVDALMNPIAHLESDELRGGLIGLNYVDFKSDLKSASSLIGEASVDEYEFLKNAYFQKRESQINDGELTDFPEE